ncbi:unnamed protein product [Vicia faba]|uniref:Leucine-rich repeat-containing N-terminal plant-type domain-containing protein n=1 Tax=Vicia faba TaxID=3906 RepID=A0AAV1AMU0_VICFA|nr:unnamed protein product [Vicia faba]
MLLLVNLCQETSGLIQFEASLKWKQSLPRQPILDSWIINNSSSTSTRIPCSWRGITCDSKGTVTILNLAYTELQQGVQLTKIAPEYSVDEPENQLAQKADLCFRSEKPHWMPSGFISLSGGAEMTKEENMTKAIKNILSENFDDDEATESQTLLYKNLWLEAEAALCSVSHKNRYNQMKIEMEKQSYKQRDMEQHSKSEVIPSLRWSESYAIEVNKCLNSDSSAATIPKELSQSKFSSDMNRLDSLTPEADGGQNFYNFIHNYAVSGINKEVAGNDEASVMARYNVIKSRDDNSCINANDLETPSHTADILAAQVADNQNQVNFFSDFLIPGKNMADYETSVLARFHFLKSRAAEDSSSVSSTEKLFEFSGEGTKETEGRWRKFNYKSAGNNILTSCSRI